MPSTCSTSPSSNVNKSVVGYTDPQGGFKSFLTSLATAPLDGRRSITTLHLHPYQGKQTGPALFHPQEISAILSLLPNLKGLHIEGVDFAIVGLDYLAKVLSGSSPRYRLEHLTLESISSPILTPTHVTKWKSPEHLVITFATVLSLFDQIETLDILDCGGIWDDADYNNIVDNMSSILPREQTIRVNSLAISTEFNEPVLAPLLALLNHLFGRNLQDFCVRQIWELDDIPYMAPLLSHGNIITWNVNLAGTLDDPENQRRPPHDLMANLALSCTGRPEKISLGVTRTDKTNPSVMVNEICTALTVVSLLPAYGSLSEIELYFDVRGEVTEEKLMRALVGTREHWGLVDQKLAFAFPQLSTLTIRFEDNYAEGNNQVHFQQPDHFTAHRSIAFDTNDTEHGTNQETSGFRQKEVNFDWFKSERCVSVTHPMQLCKFHDETILFDPSLDFFEDIFVAFFGETMVLLRDQDKLNVITERAPWNDLD